MKKIIALGAITMVSVSAFMQPAMARRGRGNVYGVMGFDEQTLGSQFKLFDTDESGNDILNTASDDDVGFFGGDDIGLFRGAVVDLVAGFGRLKSAESPEVFDSNGNPIFNEEFKQTSSISETGDLLAELIEVDGEQVIRYSIFEKYDGVTEPFIKGLTLNPTKLGTTSPNFGVSKPINLKQAVNDLSYILNNNLLDATRGAFDDLDGNQENGKEFFSGSSGIIKVENIKAVPEPTLINNPAHILVLTGFGVCVVLKRNKKQNQTVQSIKQ